MACLTDHPKFGCDAFYCSPAFGPAENARANTSVYTLSGSNCLSAGLCSSFFLCIARRSPLFEISLFRSPPATAPELDKDGHRYPRRPFTPHGVARADADGRLGLERLSRPDARRGDLRVAEAVTDRPFRSLWQATSQIPATVTKSGQAHYTHVLLQRDLNRSRAQPRAIAACAQSCHAWRPSREAGSAGTDVLVSSKLQGMT